MRNTGEWVSIPDEMPAMERKVFVYSDVEKRVHGPVHLPVLQGTDVKYIIGQKAHFPSGPTISDTPASNNIFAIYWFEGGQVFEQFMPTFWAALPELRNS